MPHQHWHKEQLLTTTIAMRNCNTCISVLMCRSKSSMVWQWYWAHRTEILEVCYIVINNKCYDRTGLIVEEVLSEYMSNESESNDHYSVIGTRPLRPDGVDKVTGRAQYGADIHMPRLAYGKVLRSPHAHANIRAIDTTKAESLSGVIAVVTSKEGFVTFFTMYCGIPPSNMTHR